MHPTTIGVDLAKHVFQAHGIDAAGEVVIRKKLQRSQVKPFFAELPVCLVTTLRRSYSTRRRAS